MRLNTGLPIFIDSAKNSLFTPQVPSWPAQRSTVLTVVSGIHSSASRVFWPIVLHARMAGDVVADLAERLLEVPLQQPVLVAQHEILERIEHRVGDRLHVGVVREHAAAAPA